MPLRCDVDGAHYKYNMYRCSVRVSAVSQLLQVCVNGVSHT
uniref:Uncharacterized protein n=1 Tax=Anguilla anguilla TaxID=7936 RepID=A0A0E9SVL4_ANGAN